MKQLKWIYHNPAGFIASVAFVIMITTVFANVMLRFITGLSLVWTEEVSAISFLWCIFVGAAACYKERNGLISMDVVVSLLHGRKRLYANLILDAAQVVICVIFYFLGFRFAQSAANKLSMALRVSYTVYDIPVAIGFAFMAYYAIRHTMEDVQLLRTPSATKKKKEEIKV